MWCDRCVPLRVNVTPSGCAAVVSYHLCQKYAECGQVSSAPGSPVDSAYHQGQLHRTRYRSYSEDELQTPVEGSGAAIRSLGKGCED